MSRVSELNKTIRLIIEYVKTLPPGIAILTVDDLPFHPINGVDERVSYWLIHITKAGSGPRPKLSGAKFCEGIADLGQGWKLAQVRIEDFHIGYAESVVDKIKEKVALLTVADHSLVN